MNHDHDHGGRSCVTCAAAEVAATLERSRKRTLTALELAFLAGLSALVVAWLLP